MRDPSESPRREAIMRAATALIARQGFHGVGMRAIADAVGVRTSSLYHHFPSKVELLLAISVESTQAFVEAHVPVLEGDGRPSDRLREVLRRHILYFHEHRAEEAVGLAHLRELRELEPESYEAVQAIRRRYQRAVASVIADGVAAGEFDVADPGLASLEVLGLVNSIGTWHDADNPTPIEAVADEYVRVAVERILGQRAGSTT